MSSYGQFCPVAKAMEVLDERWTLLVVRELMAGSTHFNELRRGNPKMSPALLSKRLRSPRARRRHPTRRGRRPHQLPPDRRAGWSSSRSSRASAPGASAGSASSARTTSTRTCCSGTSAARSRSTRGRARRTVVRVRVHRPAGAAPRRWWLCVTGDDADVCDYDPGFDVTATVVTTLSTMVAALARRPRLGRRAAHRRRSGSRRPPTYAARCRRGSARWPWARCRGRSRFDGRRIPTYLG